MSENGLIRLVSIILSFLLWQGVIIAVLFLLAFDILDITGLKLFGSRIMAVAAIIGIAPALLPILSWRLFEFLAAWFITHYRRKHLIIPKQEEQC